MKMTLPENAMEYLNWHLARRKTLSVSIELPVRFGAAKQITTFTFGALAKNVTYDVAGFTKAALQVISEVKYQAA
jgi:ribosome-associated toxin RatA of RatAB toxin-antitoxin module